jgi:uncharacterized membrane protein
MKLFQQKINLARIPKWIPIVVLIIAIIGFADATYLTVEHFKNVIPPCTVGGCETVLTSSYSQVLGIPVSLFGTVYYFIIMILMIVFLDTKKELALRIPSLLSILGGLASLYFIILMVFVIKEFCQYCALSALTSLSIFAFSAYILKKHE